MEARGGPPTAAVLNSLIAHPENRAGPPTPALHWGGKGRDLPFSTFCWDYFLEGESAYVPLKTCGTGEGIELIRELGGGAHPGPPGKGGARGPRSPSSLGPPGGEGLFVSVQPW